MPRVSVVVPVYNAEAYLAAAVDSILAQDHQDLEIILVDDGSTDGSRAVIESFGDRVRGIFQANAGPSAARNAGIRAARSDYVAFCDADDIQLSHRIATHLAVLERFAEIALVGGDLSELVDGRVTVEHALHHFWIGPTQRPFAEELARAFGAHKTCRELGLPVPGQHVDRHVYAGRAAPLIALMHLCWGNASLFRKDALEEVGGFDERVGQYEDWHLVARIALRHPIAYVDVPVMHYRRHPDQISKNPTAAAAGILHLVEDVWRRAPGFYEAHREVVDRVAGAAYYQTGTAAARTGDWADAQRAFTRSIQAYPRQRRAYLDLMKAAVRSRIG